MLLDILSDLVGQSTGITVGLETLLDKYEAVVDGVLGI
jgi:hypothetical protein